VLFGNHRRPVLFEFLLQLAGGVPVSAVVAVFVELTAAKVPAHYQLCKCSLDCFAAYSYALLRL
jgi:hypothetical protein